MSLSDAQRDLLKASAARDQAEELLTKMQATFEQAKAEADQRGDLTDQQRAEGEQAMRQALESTQRMIASLNEAMSLAQRATRQGGWAEEAE